MCADGTVNATHGSDSPTSATREFAFHFPEEAFYGTMVATPSENQGPTKEEEEAATRVQAAVRGHQSRQRTPPTPEAMDSSTVNKLEEDEFDGSEAAGTDVDKSELADEEEPDDAESVGDMFDQMDGPSAEPDAAIADPLDVPSDDIAADDIQTTAEGMVEEEGRGGTGEDAVDAIAEEEA